MRHTHSRCVYTLKKDAFTLQQDPTQWESTPGDMILYGTNVIREQAATLPPEKHLATTPNQTP